MCAVRRCAGPGVQHDSHSERMGRSVMDAHSVMTLILTAGGVVVALWVLHKIGKALAATLEALATVAAVLVTLWLVVKAAFWVVRTAVLHWRSTLTFGVLAAWLLCWGWLSLVITAGTVTSGLVVWRFKHRASFDPWVGRRIKRG